MASPCSTDGGATHFEARVAASCLAATFAEAPARGVPGLSIMEVLTQRAAFGDPLDDLVIAGQLDDGTRSKLHLQVKNERAFTGALTEFLISELDSISGLLSRKKRRSMDSLGERHRKMSIPIAGGNHSPDPEAVRFPAAWLSVSQRRWGAGVRQTSGRDPPASPRSQTGPRGEQPPVQAAWLEAGVDVGLHASDPFRPGFPQVRKSISVGG